ncbi:MAG: alginate lyase family protein [Lentisphaeria bacterium]|nr:alginate lyase family protein [Lentisphaeria bacterium]
MKSKTVLALFAAAAGATLHAAGLPTIPAEFIPTAEQLSERPMAARALDELRGRRKALLKQPPISVTLNKRLPSPGGDPRDFTSCGPYWWPDPARPDGLPYIRRDGEFNPDFKAYDQIRINDMSKWVTAGALLWHFDRDEAAAAKAVELARIFFIDEATRMNPHMRYAQAIPGRTGGRVEGIIDTIPLADLVNMFVLLKDAPAMKPEYYRALQQWFESYTRWLLTDRMARQDFGRKQNHGLSYHAQIIAYASFCGNGKLAAEHLEIMRGLIVNAVDERGFLPEETVRTRSWHYSAFALQMIFRAAGAGRARGADLLDPASASGQAVRRAVDRMLGCWLDPADRWPYPVPDGPPEPAAFGNVVLQYHAWTGSEAARRALEKLPEPKLTPVNRILFAPAAFPEK